jgi:hypothetical protein
MQEYAAQSVEKVSVTAFSVVWIGIVRPSSPVQTIANPMDSKVMRRPKRDPAREDRIHNEAIVDVRPEEQAMNWYYYLEGKISFPFRAKCLAANAVSPLRKGGSRRGATDGRGGSVRARHACADPLARPQDSSATESLGRSGLLPLTYARLPKAHHFQ